MERFGPVWLTLAEVLRPRVRTTLPILGAGQRAVNGMRIDRPVIGHSAR